jgi:hypothetical protein
MKFKNFCPNITGAASDIGSIRLALITKVALNIASFFLALFI